MRRLLLAALLLASLGACGSSHPDSASPRTTATSGSPTTTFNICAHENDLPGCPGYVAQPTYPIRCRVWFKDPGCPYEYIDSNTGMAVISAPDGRTYNVPVNDGYYYVQSDGSVTAP